MLGGREIHPINVRVGGFYRVPAPAELAALAEPLKRARDAALETVRWVAGFDFPDRERDYIFVSLRHPGEYPLNEGRIVSSRGLDIAADQYDEHFEEMHVPRSTALHSRLKDGTSYLVGPLARYSLNFDRLSPLAQAGRARSGARRCVPQSLSQHRGARRRGALCLRRGAAHRRRLPGARSSRRRARAAGRQRVSGRPKRRAACSSIATGWTTTATIAEARIVPPTSQNQATIEEDLTGFVGGFLDLPDEALRHRCEQTVRNYDPCISCSTHFLRLEMDRG